MAARKRQDTGSSSRLSSSSSSDAIKKQKRQMTVSTFNRWQSQYNREHCTLAWLRCDKDTEDRKMVSTLWCAVCRKYEQFLVGHRNFSKAWIDGTTNHKTSSLMEHTTSQQHADAMVRFNKERGLANNESIASFSPIARCLLKIDPTTRARMRKKFDVCYFLAKEGLAFKKYPGILELEMRHEVDIGPAYQSDTSCQLFTHYIAQSQRESFVKYLSSKRFFSFMMDGTTDSGNLEDELIVVLFCQKDDACGEIKSCTRYLTVVNPEKANTEGLAKCLGESLKRVGVENVFNKADVLKVKPIVVGGGTDGASVNIGHHKSLKEEVQKRLPWAFWSWCYAHRLELATKDALLSGLFKGIEEMLLRVYCLYEKSPKKARELVSIVNELKEVFMFPRGGNMPIRSQGSRWISHKRSALQRIVDRYGAYMSHLVTLSEDASLKGPDRARVSGYLKKWSDAKIIIGCAMYIEVLKPPSILSLSLQGSDVDIVFAMKQILKTTDALKSLVQLDPLQWPTVKLLMDSFKDEGIAKTYQGSVLKGYNSAAIEFCKKEALADMKRLEASMRQRLEWSDVKLLRSILVFVETQSWVKRPTDSTYEDASMTEIKVALQVIFEVFSEPLEVNNISLSVLLDELEDTVDYARRYLSIESTKYRKVWYLLHVCPDAEKWPSVLALCELVFSLPFSNGRVEQIFSSLKVIKTNNQTSLKTTTLDDLLEICIEGPVLSRFSADSAIDLWWRDYSTTRRTKQKKRKQYRSRCPWPHTTSEEGVGSSQSRPIDRH